VVVEGVRAAQHMPDGFCINAQAVLTVYAVVLALLLAAEAGRLTAAVLTSVVVAVELSSLGVDDAL
jgi:hypothetical protein